MEDYLPIHDWFDESKSHIADFRHRALRHHSQGIFWAEQVFGTTITNSDGKAVPVRFIGEQHVLEDLGWIPSVKDWFESLMPQDWMRKAPKDPSKELPPLTTKYGVPIDTDEEGNPIPDQPGKYVEQSIRNRTGGF